MQKIKACTTQLHYTLLNTWKLLHPNTWKLLHPRMAFPPWLLCCRCTGTDYNTVLNSRICQRCSTWSFTNFCSQTACNKPGNENRPIAIFSGTKHLLYGTGTGQRIPGLSRTFRDTWQLCNRNVLHLYIWINFRQSLIIIPKVPLCASAVSWATQCCVSLCAS